MCNELVSGMLTSQSQQLEWPKLGKAKCVNLSRSFDVKVIWTSDTGFSTIFNKISTYIDLKSAIKCRQLSDKHQVNKESIPDPIYKY